MRKMMRNSSRSLHALLVVLALFALPLLSSWVLAEPSFALFRSETPTAPLIGQIAAGAGFAVISIVLQIFTPQAHDGAAQISWWASTIAMIIGLGFASLFSAFVFALAVSGEVAPAPATPPSPLPLGLWVAYPLIPLVVAIIRKYSGRHTKTAS